MQIRLLMMPPIRRKLTAADGAILKVDPPAEALNVREKAGVLLRIAHNITERKGNVLLPGGQEDDLARRPQKGCTGS